MVTLITFSFFFEAINDTTCALVCEVLLGNSQVPVYACDLVYLPSKIGNSGFEIDVVLRPIPVVLHIFL